jgi:hypothetical protein
MQDEIDPAAFQEIDRECRQPATGRSLEPDSRIGGVALRDPQCRTPDGVPPRAIRGVGRVGPLDTQARADRKHDTDCKWRIRPNGCYCTDRPSGFANSGRSQGRKRPRPGLPAGLPSRQTASPREKVAIGQPFTVMPS